MYRPIGILLCLVAFAAAALSRIDLPQPKPPVLQEASNFGPGCTFVYPRGFKVPKGTKKRPLAICEGDLQTTWRTCTPRYKA